MKQTTSNIFAQTFLVLAIFAMLCGIFCGCTKTIYQPVESVRTDSIVTNTTIDNERFQMLMSALERRVNTKDSVIIRDSVVMVINEAGGIVSKETFHDRDRNYTKDEAVLQIQAKYDSIINAQREEFNAILEQIQQIPVPVEKPLSKWEQTKMDVGGVSIGILIAIAVIAVIWLIKKIKHQQ